MDKEVELKQPKFYNYVTKALDKGFLSHAYLIETVNNSIEIVDKYISFLVKKIYELDYKKNNVSIPYDKLMHLIENDEFPDYLKIKPLGNQIKKEQLLFIKDEFSNKSLYGTSKVYVVYFCDKMNASAANTILKFLEEPASNVIAIFVTNNQYSVLDTIRSRCQVISLVHETLENKIVDEKILNFIDDIKQKDTNNLLIKFNYYSKELFKDRQEIETIVKEIINYYEDELNKKDSVDLEYILNIISIFEDSLKKLRYNVNIKLWIDELLLSLMEV